MSWNSFKWSLWTSWFYELSFIQAIAKISEVGFNYIEVSGEHLNELVFLKSEDVSLIDRTNVKRVEEISRKIKGLKISEIVDKLESYGVKIIHAHGMFDFCRNAIEFYPKIDKLIRKLKVWLTVCNELNINVVVLHPCSLPYAYHLTEKFNLTLFNEVGRLLRDFEIKVAIENMDTIYWRDVRRIISLIESLKYSEYFGICLDTSHANISKYRSRVQDAIREASNYIIATHISDNFGARDDHLFPGRGLIDWQSVLEAFLEIKYSKPLNLEVPGESGNLTTEEKIVKIRKFLMEKAII